MLADIADENELETGVRREGVIYAFRAFTNKVTSLIGILIGVFYSTHRVPRSRYERQSVGGYDLEGRIHCWPSDLHLYSRRFGFLFSRLNR